MVKSRTAVEPDMATAFGWWCEPPDKWTPIGWKNHMFRYNVLSRVMGKGDPVSILMRDRVMWLVLAAYVVMVALVISYGRLPAVRGLLDTGASGT